MEKEFNDLIENIKKCEICKDKFGFQPHPIFLGNINSKIVQISQAPSATVHETLKPFTDKFRLIVVAGRMYYAHDKFYTSIEECKKVSQKVYKKTRQIA